MPPVEQGKKYKDWHCTRCGEVYARRDTTRREVLNNWWQHMKERHPSVYKAIKKKATKKMLATKRKLGLIGKKTKGRRKKRRKRKK